MSINEEMARQRNEEIASSNLRDKTILNNARRIANYIRENDAVQYPPSKTHMDKMNIAIAHSTWQTERKGLVKQLLDLLGAPT